MNHPKKEIVGGLEPWIFMTFHILGISSSQLTNSFFFRGVGSNYQPEKTARTSGEVL